MAFPVIPTVAAGRVVTAANTAGGATKTFTNILNGLTKSAGDLLIAIVIIYDGNSTNAEFSGWTAGWTEFADRAGTTTMGIGCAYKFSTGSETGSIAVTTADTSTNDSVCIVMAIPGAHVSTPPEASPMTTGTAAAADPASFDPTGWGAEDTLWIAVGGSGEDATTGTFTGIAGPPTNYGDGVQTGITADVVGGVEGAVAFRQLNAASEDVGPRSVDTSNARNAALVIAVRPDTRIFKTLSVASVANTAQVLTVLTSPTITSASVNDSGRAYSDQAGGPFQDVAVSFSGAMTKLGGSYSVGDTIPGLTIQVNGGADLAVTYRSGEDGTDWVVRVGQLVQNGQTVVLDYSRAAGELVSTTSALELVAYTDRAVTNNLSKRIRPLLKKADGSVAASTTVVWALLERDGNDPANANYLARTDKGSTSTDSSGRLDVAYTGSASVGSSVGFRGYLMSANSRPLQAYRKQDVTVV